ncbi:peptide chain release factor 1 [Candidatus Riflebacteria bacterium]
MIEKLHSIKKSYHEIEKELTLPDIFKNQKRYRELGKKRAELEEIVKWFDKYLTAEQAIKDSKELLETEEDVELLEMAREEIEENEKSMTAIMKRLKILLLPKDPNDHKNTIVEIRAGTGGDEAGLFCADLLKMYNRYADSNKWKIEMLSASETGVGGFKEVIFLIKGKDVFSHLKYEGGVHRVQRVPETEAQGRVHTSAATVAVLPEIEDYEFHLDEKELQFDVYRSSGPGGQSVNTTDSAVRVIHIPTGLKVTCQDEKSQHKNKAKAIKILSARLAKLEQDRLQKERASERKSMVGSGDRSERIRTYNFPQNRMTDHRIGLTLHKLEAVMAGEIGEIIKNLRNYYQLEALKNLDS